MASEHNGRLDILETDNTSSKINITSNTTRIVELESDVTSNTARIVELESDVSSNTARIVELENDVSSNTTRIVELESDVSSNTTRIVELEDHDSNHALRLTDLETQAFEVEHVPNKHEDDFFYFTPYPVPYDVLEAYSQLIHDKSLTLKDSQLIHDKSLTLKDRVDPSNNDIRAITEVIQEILQDHEMKIVALEFFNSLSEAKTAAKFLWATGKVLKNKFGKKIIAKLFPNWSSMSEIGHELMNGITDTIRMYYVRMYVCIHTYVCIYIYLHTHLRKSGK